MRASPHIESCLIRMPIIALLLMTAGAGAQTERSMPASPPGAMVQPIPPEYGRPSQWDRVQAQIGQPTDGSIAGTISQWRDDALTALDALTEGPQVVVGSSMGGWIALLLALARPQRVRGLVLLAPAPDFTQTILDHELSPTERERLQRDGRIERPSEYSEQPYVITRRLIEDGQRHRLLDAPIALSCPVRIVHGMRDSDVAWQQSITLIERLQGEDSHLTLLKNGDHRLSGDADLARLTGLVDALCGA